MKTSETLTTTSTLLQQDQNKQENQPFFKKEGDRTFFSEASREIQTKPFFSPDASHLTAYHSNPGPFFSPATIQPKLSIGKPGDKYEQEADAMADKVVTQFNSPAPSVQKKCAACGEEEKLQKKEEEPEELSLKEESIQRKSIFESNDDPPEDHTIQRKCAACEEDVSDVALAKSEEQVQKIAAPEEEENIQQKSESANSTASPDIESRLQSTKGGGRPLPKDTAHSMSTAFGADFSRVNIHTGSDAVQLNKDLGAQAFTHGSDIYFNEGKYDTQTGDGQHLLAHELAHNLQQGGASIKRSVPDIQRNGNTKLERLNEMLDRFNVPEEEVITLCGQLSGPEKTTVLAGGYRSRMASAFNVNEMVRAVNHLGPVLATKLEWVNDASFTTSSIDYSDIQGMVRSADPTEKNNLKINFWKNFFVSVCTNETMVTALDDLGFDLETKLTWIEAEMTITSWELDYATIRPWIIHPNTSRTQKDALITDRWRNFFVSVCTNATMVTALDDLGFDLETKLTWIEAEMTITSWELDYATIRPWIIHANTNRTQKDALITDRWRNFFVSVCTNATMVTALDDLGYDLETKLNWIEAEMTITSWELDYATIRPWIIHANTTQAQKNGLKTNRWKTFFVKVCTNNNIITAVTDLGFDFKTRFEWIFEEGTDYLKIKAFILGMTAAEKTANLSNQDLLILIRDNMAWNDFAKCVELLGRSAPSGATMIADANVQAGLTVAWTASNPQITNWSTTHPNQPANHPCQPPPPPPAYLAHEEGGFIYLNLITGDISTSAVASGGQAGLTLGSPAEVADSIVVGGYHTHPNVGNCWGAPFFSNDDNNWTAANGVPLLMRGAFPTVANTSDHNTGNTRAHLAGDRGLPGTAGGIAPQATIDGAFDEL